MPDVFCFCYVEDALSAAVARKLVAARNAKSEHALLFREGFPSVMRGYGNIKKHCDAFLKMARAGMHTLILADLDTAECACTLIRDWFNIPRDRTPKLPSPCLFRVVVREIESWVIADREAWGAFIGISPESFAARPDELDDPKMHLLNVLRKKGGKRMHRDMLPQGIARIGPRYNQVLCDFVDGAWEPERASERSPSLKRALNSLMRI